MSNPWDDRIIPGVDCCACGEKATYWEMRVSVHDSVSGFEVISSGFDHPDGTTCEEW
ncbi:hypothetical protein [Mycobacterium phage WXIN]|nr:hypothetical protein [Mycobacterium phage WXIN]